jgi:hypothetical protein
MTKPAGTAEIFSLKTAIRRKWQRLQRPGNHWFFLLYLGGLLAIFAIASLLKFGIKLL